MIDQNKRKSLKAIGVTGIGVVAGGGFSLAAACRNDPVATVSITHYENVYGHTLLIRNHTATPIALEGFGPGAVPTPLGELDLNSVTRDGPLKIKANGTQAVHLSLDGSVHQYASWTHLESPAAGNQPLSGFQSVSYTGRFGDDPASIRSATFSARLA